MLDNKPLHDTLGSLSRALLTEDSNLQAGLRRIAEAGCALLRNCAGASVTIIEHSSPATVGATNELAMAIDQSQYEVDDGPCLSAARESRTIRIDDVSVEGRWPHYRTAAVNAGILSTLALPLHLETESYRGGLNIYGQVPGAFGDDDEQLASMFADQASIIVANTRAYWAAFEMTRNLTAAMESREVIEQAKGVLMVTHRLSADGAFDRLRQRSQAENRKLRDIARETVDDAIRGGA